MKIVEIKTAAAKTTALILWLTWAIASASAQTQINIPGPTDSGGFGTSVTVLSNGNFVVTDPLFGANDEGAAYLYDGRTGGLIRRMTGGTAGDHVGSGGVYALPNGNYVVSSPDWSNGNLSAAGIATFCSGTEGCGSVLSGGSLAGDLAGSRIGGAASASGFKGITVLSNGDYVVSSPDWSIDAVRIAVGAVTRCSATAGCPGTILSLNSLIGEKSGDSVGSVSTGSNRVSGVTALTNGGYVVSSPNWDIGAVLDVGAVTWCGGGENCVGAVSMSNSLTGNAARDRVGESSGINGVVVLTNGNYVVNNSDWGNAGASGNRGAITWCAGTAGCVGTVSSTNSMVGSAPGNYFGSGGITVLPNGNYVVRSPSWDNGAVQNVGAATFCRGTAGCIGTVQSNSSLIGSAANSFVGESVTVLTNGNYVVGSPQWLNGANAVVGAVTFCSGAEGCTGAVSGSNSLIGGRPGDNVGNRGVTALTNGNYVVSSSNWDSDIAINAGAVTWCSGATGCVGLVTAFNSLIGSTPSDNVGIFGTVALANGRYVALSPGWNNGTIQDVGAATFCADAAGCTGVVSASNSLVGSRANDRVGGSATLLNNGNYVVVSTAWDKVGAAGEVIESAGAVTWCDGVSGCTGAVTAANSLIGSTAGDQVGFVFSSDNKVTALPNGDYAVGSKLWDNGGIVNAGAVTYGSGGSGTVGEITAANSVRGTTANPVSDSPFQFAFAYDAVNRQLVVGRRLDNIVTLVRPSVQSRTPFDFDGDGRADFTVFRPSEGNWYRTNSSNDSFVAVQFGISSDKLAPADYDGDGRTDIAVYRAGVWHILQTTNNQLRSVSFGAGDDLPRPADFDGDGKADITVFRPSAGTWFYLQSSNNQFRAVQFGQLGDVPIIGDYDADGKSDITVFRPSEGTWYRVNSSNGQFVAAQFGTSGDIPLSGDFNGDGRSDLAVYRESNGFWYVARSTGTPSQNFDAVQFGADGDVPVAADYDGDGKADIAVYRGGNWLILKSLNNQFAATQFGLLTDKPVQAAFQP